MSAWVAAGASFLLAVLWFDLMFDVQAARQPPGPLPEPRLSSIASYYARVTTAARPMNRVIAIVMLATLIAIGVEIARGSQPSWVPWASLALASPAIVLAAIRTVPSAIRLGARADDPDRQSELARAILRDHLFCLGAMASVVAIQLIAG